jgi:hypothetical protein
MFLILTFCKIVKNGPHILKMVRNHKFFRYQEWSTLSVFLRSAIMEKNRQNESFFITEKLMEFFLQFLKYRETILDNFAKYRN